MGLLQRAASRLVSLWRNITHRQAADDDLDDEVRATFDLFVDEQVRSGMDPVEARRRATIELGRTDAITTQVREARSGAGLETLWHDAAFGARLLRRNPLFASTAVLSLAIGIGANTAMFTIVNALLLRDVQVAAPRQLVELWRTTQFGSGTAFSYPAYERLRDENTVFSGVLAVEEPDGGKHELRARAGTIRVGQFSRARLTPPAGCCPRATVVRTRRRDRPSPSSRIASGFTSSAAARMRSARPFVSTPCRSRSSASPPPASTISLSGSPPTFSSPWAASRSFGGTACCAAHLPAGLASSAG